MDEAKNARRKIQISEKQLTKKFKHASDFGIYGICNIDNLRDFKSAIKKHLSNEKVLSIPGTFRGAKVIHYLDPNTELNVIVDMSENFVSGWKLSSSQRQHVQSTGKLGGN